MSTVVSPTFLRRSRSLCWSRTSLVCLILSLSLTQTRLGITRGSLFSNPSFSGSMHSRRIPYFMRIEASISSIPDNRYDRSYLQIFCLAHADHLPKEICCSVHDRREQAIAQCRVSISVQPHEDRPFPHGVLQPADSHRLSQNECEFEYGCTNFLHCSDLSGEDYCIVGYLSLRTDIWSRKQAT
jgi:hypothetical protein